MSSDNTPNTFGGSLLESLHDYEKRRARGEKLTMRSVSRTAPAPKAYSGQAIATLRGRLNVSQDVFATLLASSPATVKAWEAGRKAPSPMARRLLETIDSNPAHFEEMLEVARNGGEVKRDERVRPDRRRSSSRAKIDA